MDAASDTDVDAKTYVPYRLGSVDFSYISTARFETIKNHFEDVLESISNDDAFTLIKAEFSYLYHLFKSCFYENERKSHKIHELIALSTVEVSKLEIPSSGQDESANDMKKTINRLQRELDKVIKQRKELLEDLEDLSKTVQTQNKIIQVRTQSLEALSQGKYKDDSSFATEVSKVKRDDTIVKKDEEELDASKKHFFETAPKDMEKTDDTEAEVLKNNLNILVLDLKLARRQIYELKEAIQNKNTLVTKYCKDLSDSKILLKTAESKIVEVQKPWETRVAQYRAELVKKSHAFELIYKELDEYRDLNEKLTKNISAKESAIDDLKAQVEKLEFGKESALRRAEVFEIQLAKSQNYNEALKNEADDLKKEIYQLVEHGPKALPQPEESDQEMKTELIGQERSIMSLKNHIALRDDRLRQVEDELKSTIETYQSVKKDLNVSNKEKYKLECEVRNLRNMLKDKMEDMKELREKLNEEREEAEKMKRELSSQIRKHQQLVEKKNKMYSRYNHVKYLNTQQKNENAILGKRQQYLVKILKEKDMEIEKIVTWKRFIC